MAIINYAIEINSGVSGVTDTDYACVAGVIRLITGRPGYVGAPTYPTGEAGIAASSLQARWFEGWLAKEGVGTAVRSVDPSVAGQYGVLSSFSFTMENSRKWWAWAETNAVWLANKPIKLFVVIDNVFYFQWSGVIREQPRTDTELHVRCIDAFKTVHKQIPPTDISETNYPDAIDDSKGKSIPVCFGDVPYAEMRNVSGEPDYMPLINDSGLSYKTTAAYSYFSSGSPDGLSYVHLIVSPDINKDDIGGVGNQNYLMVTRGGGDPDTDTAYKIFSAIDGFPVTVNGKAMKILEVAFWGALSVSPSAFVPGYALDITAGTVSVDVWWFRIAKLSVECVVSEKEISGFETSGSKPIVVKYDTDSKKESDVSYIVGSSDAGAGGTRPQVTLVSRNITKDGDILVEAIATPIVYDMLFTDEAELYDRDRSTSLPSESTWVPLRVRIPTDVDWSEYDSLYLCFDIEREASLVNSGCFEIVVSARGPFNQDMDGLSQTTYFPAQTNYSLTEQYYNWIPNAYYENGGDSNGEASRWNRWETLGGVNVNNKDHLEITGELLEAIKNGDIFPVLTVGITLLFSGASAGATIKVKEVAVLGVRKVSITDGNVYARLRGELTGTAETNTVYNTAKHILEDYDGIAAADIDYHNLATSRGDWHVGRQLTDKKSSYDYLRELCAQAFICIIPKRNGNRRLTAWREDNDFSTLTHDESTIQRNSLRKLDKSQISRVYNVFKLKYAWHPGRGEFIRSVTVDKVNESAFPAFGADADGDGIDDWKTYVGGLADSSYADAKALWDIAHASYLRSSAVNELPQNFSILSWFTDFALFKPGVASYFLSTGSSAFKALRNFVEWTTRQFDLVEYSIPVNATNAVLELLKPITFNDALLTNDVDREGWLTVLKLDPKRDRITVEALLQPADISTESVDGDIDETGDAPDTIDESGSRTDTITEGA